MRKRVLAAVAFLLLLAPWLPAQQSEAENELQSYIARQSAVWFDQETEKTGVADPGPWQDPIESAFLRIANSSGQPGFTVHYAVLKDGAFNAACFPGGQFVVNAGTLQILDMIIQTQVAASLSSIDPQKLRVQREMLLAPVIAHELSHYYCRHIYQSMKMRWTSTDTQKDIFDIRMLRFTQDNELEADRLGYLLLKRAGYNPDLMLGILGLLNDIRQAKLKEAPSDAFNTYLDTHPSPHARLAAFQSENQKLHKWAADLERAFSDVQLGTNLEQALKTIEDGLQLVPGNLYLEKERAIALHKQWMATVPLKEQRLRAIIDSPAFRDEMVFSSRGARGAGKVIPGDRRLFLKAREAYLATYDKSDDPGFRSNFAVLLAYSPDANDEKGAVVLALASVKAAGTYENANNFAAVLYLVGQKEQAISVLAEIAGDFDQKYTAMLGAAEEDSAVYESLRAFKAKVRMTQTLNQTYVSGNFTPLLNLALCLAYSGQKDTAKQVAADYLRRYEASSAWAQYLSATAGAQIPGSVEKVPRPVRGVQIGSTVVTVVERWGKPTAVAAVKEGDEDWEYAALGVELAIRSGIVYSIALNDAASPKVDNAFGVGTPRADIEKLLGQPKRTSASYSIYEGPQNVAVLYARDVAQQVVLFP